MEEIFLFILLLLAFPCIIICAIIHGILFGSSVDPDDNGILNSKKKQAKMKEQKLKNMEKF